MNTHMLAWSANQHSFPAFASFTFAPPPPPPTCSSKDTEFPGIVYHPQQAARSSFEYNYQTLKLNVDLLKIIQLGLCFCAEDARIYGPTVWQFNFKFDLQHDAHAQNSIDLLTKHGIQWKRHETDGIDVVEFAELLIASGVACNPG